MLNMGACHRIPKSLICASAALAVLVLIVSARPVSGSDGTTDGRKAAVDMRLVDDDSPDDCRDKANQRVRVGEILIVGNTETPQGVILDLLGFCPGQKISAKNMRQAESRIKRLGFWKSAEISVLDSDNGWSPILVKIEEKEWNWLIFGVGYVLVLFGWTADIDYFGDAVQRLAKKFREVVLHR
jgi:Surface antigen variable number repeat